MWFRPGLLGPGNSAVLAGHHLSSLSLGLLDSELREPVPQCWLPGLSRLVLVALELGPMCDGCSC